MKCPSIPFPFKEGRLLIFLVLLCGSSGCSHPDQNSELPANMEENYWMYFRSYENVIVVGVEEEWVETNSPPEKHKKFSKATVVRVVKGKWRVGEDIVFCNLIEDALPIRSEQQNERRLLLFLGEHSKDSIPLEVGQAWKYDTSLDRILFESGEQNE